MEIKKNPSKDLTRQTKKFFLIGLSISLAIVITAFEWSSVKKKSNIVICNFSEPEIPYLLQAIDIDQPKVPQLIVKQPFVKSNSLTPTEFVEVLNQTPLAEIPTIDLDPNPISTFFKVAEPAAEVDSIFFIVEKKPEPANGFGNFYQTLSRNVKYPQQARRIGTEGKVYVEFIVNRNGELADLKVIKGIGSGCDEEAMRVLALTKWEPGKQRGRPVRVKMVLPISFQLSH